MISWSQTQSDRDRNDLHTRLPAFKVTLFSPANSGCCKRTGTGNQVWWVPEFHPRRGRVSLFKCRPLSCSQSSQILPEQPENSTFKDTLEIIHAFLPHGLTDKLLILSVV